MQGRSSKPCLIIKRFVEQVIFIEMRKKHAFGRYSAIAIHHNASHRFRGGICIWAIDLYTSSFRGYICENYTFLCHSQYLTSRFKSKGPWAIQHSWIHQPSLASSTSSNCAMAPWCLKSWKMPKSPWEHEFNESWLELGWAYSREPQKKIYIHVCEDSVFLNKLKVSSLQSKRQ